MCHILCEVLTVVLVEVHGGRQRRDVGETQVVARAAAAHQRRARPQHGGTQPATAAHVLLALRTCHVDGAHISTH